VRDKERVSKVT